MDTSYTSIHRRQQMTAQDNGPESKDSSAEDKLTAASDKADRSDATGATESATSQDGPAPDEASPPTSEAEQRWGAGQVERLNVNLPGDAGIELTQHGRQLMPALRPQQQRTRDRQHIVGGDFIARRSDERLIVQLAQ